ncbi:hypothetical protein FOXYS1_1104 [Fusarium oxysporum]|uniref:CBM-cenC domain-containing protein n=1 Tax=Fusarium oxysporum TaxID=5507 RepID=A0A8H5EPS7_FUSOX|nr:hypothetical protein FOXYS1_1104 [Fusarium oxysporum]
MASKTLVAAFVAACFMSSSNASPCKVSSRSRDVSTSTEALTSTLKASMTTQTAFSSTVLSSTEDETITVTQSESSTETSAASDDVTTTAILSTTEILSTTDPATTLSTTQVSSTVEVSGSTTTTTEATAATQYILNGEFDDEITAPWQLVNDGTLALDATIKHDGRSSARMSFSTAGGSTSYISQAYSSPAQAGVGYPASAWVRPGPGCTIAVLGCAYGNAGLFSGRRTLVVTATTTQPGTINQWQEISYTCTYTQSQIDQGGLALNIGFMCISGSEAWIDSVTFSGQ